jgi:hypothetical protein
MINSTFQFGSLHESYDSVCPQDMQRSGGRGISASSGKRRATTTPTSRITSTNESVSPAIATAVSGSTAASSTRVSGGRGLELRPQPRQLASVARPPVTSTQSVTDNANYGQLEDRITGLFAVRSSRPQAPVHEATHEDLHLSIFKVPEIYRKGTSQLTTFLM